MEADAVAKPALAGEKTGAAAPSTKHRQHTAIWFRSPWKWFFSLGVGVSLLVILTIASVVGTLFSPLERAQALVFYTWWYKLLLLALAVNMGCATVKTLMQKLLPTRTLRIHDKKAFFETAHLATRTPFQGTVEQVTTAFRSRGFRVRCEGDAGVARSGWYGRFGAPVSHLGLMVVLLAGFASSWVAKEGIVQIPEGRTTMQMQMRPDLEKIAPLGFAITLDDFSTGFFPRTRIPSHYTSVVTVKDGDEVLYSGPVEVNHSPKIKGWRLHQTSYQEIPTLPRYAVAVEGPSLDEVVQLRVSPGQTLRVPGTVDTDFSMDAHMGWKVAAGNTPIASGSLTGGSHQDATIMVRADQFEPDFVLGENREVTSRSDELNNPALKVTLLADGQPMHSQWLFGREDMRAFSHSPSTSHKLTLVDVVREDAGYSFVVEVADNASDMLISRVLLTLDKEVVVVQPDQTGHDHADTAGGWNASIVEPVTGYASVLTLSRNPAIPTIYFGCGLMVIGLFMAFFVPRRDIWFLRDSKTGELRVAAHYRHPADTFDRKTRAALDQAIAAARQDSTPTPQEQ